MKKNNLSLILFFYKKVVYIYISSICTLFFACSELSSTTDKKAIARIGDHYLYASDLEKDLKDVTTKYDSTLRTRYYIDNWARKQLLFDRAKINLPLKTQQNLEELVKAYQFDLWGRVYTESIIKSTLDTVIGTEDINNYYSKNNENFVLNQDHIQLRYITIPSKNNDIKKISKSFLRFKESDISYLDSLSFHFNQYQIKDSVWVSKKELISKFTAIDDTNFSKYLKKTQFFRVDDSLEVSLFFVYNFKQKNEIAPLGAIYGTVKKIVFNQKKIEFIREFDKDIIEDAIQKHEFEIYN